MELNNNYENIYNYSEYSNLFEHNEDKPNILKRILDIVNLKPENDRLDIGGLSINIDTIIILAIAFFLITDNSCDILLIICLGLALLNINLNPFG